MSVKLRKLAELNHSVPGCILNSHLEGIARKGGPSRSRSAGGERGWLLGRVKWGAAGVPRFLVFEWMVAQVVAVLRMFCAFWVGGMVHLYPHPKFFKRL